MIDPKMIRALIGAGLGGLIGSGKAAGVGTAFLQHFLKPLSEKASAVEFLAKFMQAEEMAVAKLFRTKVSPWDQLPIDEQEMWRSRARNALTGLAAMISQGLAGKIIDRVKG